MYISYTGPALSLFCSCGKCQLHSWPFAGTEGLTWGPVPFSLPSSLPTRPGTQCLQGPLIIDALSRKGCRGQPQIHVEPWWFQASAVSWTGGQAPIVTKPTERGPSVLWVGPIGPRADSVSSFPPPLPPHPVLTSLGTNLYLQPWLH